MRTAVWLVLLTACATEPPAPPPAPVTYLSPTEHLTRAAMALRGVRPSIAELRAVAADPDALPAIIDRYLETPEFGEMLRDLHAQAWLIRTQDPNFSLPPIAELAGKTANEMNESIYDEPMRLIEDVVMSNQPYTRIVTASYTMADRIVATVWGMPHSPDPGWEPTHRIDPADAAGVLASPVFYIRYRNAGINMNRGRANAVSKALLCHDFLEGQIGLDTSVDLSRPDIVANAVVNNPSCAGCHQNLDPLASYFYPYPYGPLGVNAIGRWPLDIYDESKVNDWFKENRRPPAYFGHDAPGLAGLGRAIAADPRFARCAAIHFAGFLTEHDEHDLAPEWIAELQQAFVADHFNAKHLARSIVLSDQFRAGASEDPVAAEGVIGYQKVRPEQLRRMLHALTGFTWRGYTPKDPSRLFVPGPFSYFDDDIEGYRVLAGGIDSFYVTTPVHTMNATSSLVTRAAASRAATFVVAHDAAAPIGERTLFTKTDVTATDEAGVRSQLVELHGRIYGELVDAEDERVTETYTLYRDALAASGDPRRAWTLTLSGMLADLRAVYY